MCVGAEMLLLWEFFLNIQLNNCFWKIRMVLRRTYKFYSSGPEKGRFYASAVVLLLLVFMVA